MEHTNYDVIKKLSDFEKFKDAYTYVEDNLDRLVGVYGRDMFIAVSKEIVGFDSDKKGLEAKVGKLSPAPLILTLNEYLKKTDRANYKQQKEYSN